MTTGRPTSGSGVALFREGSAETRETVHGEIDLARQKRGEKAERAELAEIERRVLAEHEPGLRQ